MRVINGEDMILGRVASYVAKAALLGEEISLVNCEKIVITGNKQSIFEKQRSMSERRGKPTKGVFFERRPDFFVDRVVRRMLPKNSRGKAALKKVRCYIASPEQVKGKRETIKSADVQKLPNLKYVTIGEICTKMGARYG